MAILNPTALGPNPILLDLAAALEYVADTASLSTEKAKSWLENVLRWPGALRPRLFGVARGEQVKMADNAVINWSSSEIKSQQDDNSVRVFVLRQDIDGWLHLWQPHAPKAGTGAVSGIDSKFGEGRIKGSHVSSQFIQSFVADCIQRKRETGQRPTATDVVDRWVATGHRGYRDMLRKEFVNQLGSTQRRGRLPKVGADSTD